jgi:DNA-binding MarR family transcriptional regulator
MKEDLRLLIDQFLKILHLYAVINRKPKDYGTGDMLYLTEVHTITMIARNDGINMTRLAETMGVTRGAISQTIRKLAGKNLIIKENTTNRKEFSLRLSEKGRVVVKGQESLQQEIFSFAASLYEKADPHDREMVMRLFNAIASNMEERVRGM